MGKFILGVLSALIAGGLLLVTTPTIQRWVGSNDQQVSLSSVQSLLISPEISRSFAKNKAAGWVRLLSIRNSGDEDLSNASMTLSGEDGAAIEAFGGVFALDNAEVPALALKNGKVTIDYKLFKRGEITAFWVRTEGSEMPVLRSTQKGVNVEAVRDAEDLEIWIFFAVLSLGLLLGIICGGILVEALNNRMLKMVGLDPKEIQELYAKAIAQKT